MRQERVPFSHVHAMLLVQHQALRSTASQPYGVQVELRGAQEGNLEEARCQLGEGQELGEGHELGTHPR